MKVDQILERVGLKYEDLHEEERDTLHTWMGALANNQLTVESVRHHIRSMRDTVEHELTQVAHNTTQDIFLKARLRNYLLLEAFLTSPERAKQAMESALVGLASKKGA